MNQPLRLRQLRVFQLAVPLRLRFEHAAATRDTSDPIVVELSAAAPFANFVGHGETLARPYVTGETAESVETEIAQVFAPRLGEFRPQTFAAALEFIEALPTEVDGRIVTAARAAVELALLDLSCRVFRRRPADAAGWLGLPGFGPPGCLATARYSGIVVGRTPGRLKGLLRLQRLYGLRDFKLKVAVPGWQDRLAWTCDVLGRALETGAATLRVDANGGWSLDEAREATHLLDSYGVAALEQPLADSQDSNLADLARQTHCDLVADESLLTADDGVRLIRHGGVRVFNIRLAKNGGLLPSLKLARQALGAGLEVQLGCLVGETSILSSAGVAFLEACPKVRFVEGAFGQFLSRQDVTARPVRFGRAGRPPRVRGDGLGVAVDPARLERLSVARPRTLAF
jgi:muconate cycloisomerase